MRNALETHVAQSRKLEEYVKFHNKASRLALKQQVSSAKASFSSQKERDLSARKLRLSQLLSQENQQFSEELREKVAKPAHFPANLLQKVERMREIKEKKRAEYVEAQNQRIFRRDDAEMREIQRNREKIASFRALQGQILENQSNLLREYEENRLFAEFAERSRKREEVQQGLKAKENCEKVQRNREILQLQMKTRADEKKSAEERGKRENSEEKRYFSSLLGEIKQQEREKVQLSLDFGKRIIKENQELQREKAEKAAGRKLEEKMWVDSLLKQENEEKLRETLEKKEKHAENQRFLANYAGKPDYDQEIDAFIAKYNEKKREEEDERWRKAQEKRINLLTETYESRKSALLDKKARNQAEQRQKLEDRLLLDNLAKDALSKEICQKTAVFLREKAHKEEIQAQSLEKARLLQRKRALEEVEQALLRDLERKKQEKYADERKINENLLENLRKSFPL